MENIEWEIDLQFLKMKRRWDFREYQLDQLFQTLGHLSIIHTFFSIATYYLYYYYLNLSFNHLFVHLNLFSKETFIFLFTWRISSTILIKIQKHNHDYQISHLFPILWISKKGISTNTLDSCLSFLLLRGVRIYLVGEFSPHFLIGYVELIYQKS